MFLISWIVLITPLGCKKMDDVDNGNNKENKATFSILGDSISTMEGLNPEGYPVFYSTSLPSYGISSPWWEQFSKLTSWMLLSNSSYAGSTISRCFLKEQTCFSSSERISALSLNGCPDYIFVFGGTNDWSRSVAFEGKDPYDSTSFVGGYRYLVRKLKTTYPSSQILCLSILPRESGIDKTNSKSWTISDANMKISSICLDLSCRFVDLHDCGMLNKTDDYTFDGLHPNAQGMKLIAQCIVDQLADIL